MSAIMPINKLFSIFQERSLSQNVNFDFRIFSYNIDFQLNCIHLYAFYVNFNNKGIFDENRCDFLRRNSPRARVKVSI